MGSNKGDSVTLVRITFVSRNAVQTTSSDEGNTGSFIHAAFVFDNVIFNGLLAQIYSNLVHRTGVHADPVIFGKRKSDSIISILRACVVDYCGERGETQINSIITIFITNAITQNKRKIPCMSYTAVIVEVTGVV